jgi:uncharacterized protein (TIGR02145 family)
MLRTSFLIAMFLVHATLCIAQEIQLSFSAAHIENEIDSIIVLNQRSGEIIKLAGNESLILNSTATGTSDIFSLSDNNLLYPNPTNGFSFLNYLIPEQGNIELNVYNSTGYLIGTYRQLLSPGNHQFKITFPTNGIYFVNIKRDHDSKTFKAVNLGKKQQELQIKYLGNGLLSQQDAVKKAMTNIQHMDYKEGDILNLTLYSGNMITVISESPVNSREIQVNFHECIDPDGKNYKTVTIGHQVWMAENLAYLPSVSSYSERSITIPHYYVSDYTGADVTEAKSTENFVKFGVYYNWPAAIQANASSSFNPSGVQGVCPSGWHLPSDAEWEQLEYFLANNGFSFDGTIGGGNQTIAKSLASANYWPKHISTSPGNIGNNITANNKSGFSAIPALSNGDDEPIASCWWTSTERNLSEAWQIYIDYYSSYTMRSNDFWRKQEPYNIRCIKDEINTASVPTINTYTPVVVSSTSVLSGGEITSNGGSSIISKGIVWDTSENPSIDVNRGFTTNATGNESFETILQHLLPSTKYFIRAFATNNIGVGYGNQIEVMTAESNSHLLGSFVDSRDNKVYKTIKIGDQIWMAENLAYLPSVSTSDYTASSSTEPRYYVYYYEGTDVNQAKSTIQYQTYGVLYNWPATMEGAENSDSNPSKVQGACPAGWHIPSNSEWNQLENYLIENGYNLVGSKTDNNIGKSMASRTHWTKSTLNYPNIIGNNLAVNNRSGFSALPGGKMAWSFGEEGTLACWWSSTLNEDDYAKVRYIDIQGEKLKGDDYLGRNKASGYSIRCIED